MYKFQESSANQKKLDDQICKINNDFCTSYSVFNSVEEKMNLLEKTLMKIIVY